MAKRSIVIAVDGSPAARRAAGVGVELAAGLGADAVFLHASRTIASQLFAESPKGAESLERRLEVDPVLNEAAQVAREAGVDADFEVLGEEGSEELAPAIAGIAAALDTSLIVIGSRGHGAVASAVLGSVSLALLRSTDIPVLVVRASNTRQ